MTKKVYERQCARCGTTFTLLRQRNTERERQHCSTACRRIPLAERFEAKRIRHEVGCWGWSGAVMPFGHGVISRGAQGEGVVLAHVLAWELASGAPVPDGLCVCHTCDVPACTRDDDVGIYEVAGIAHPRIGHLWLGTHLENMQDMAEKRRHGGPGLFGADHPNAKLTWESVREMRARSKAGESSSRLATDYGINKHTVWMIVTGKAWKE